MLVPYVDRDAHGRILAGYDTPRWDEHEWVSTDDAVWQAFKGAGAAERAQWIREELARIDLHLNRALEDLIEILEANRLVREKDLPQPLLQRMAFKERLREKLRAELAALQGE